MTSEIVQALGGKGVFASRGRGIDLHEEVKKGFPTKSYRFLSRILSLTPRELDVLLEVSLRTRRRWSGRARLDPGTSDRLLRLARIYALATTVLENDAHAVAWLRGPSEALGGRTPLECAATDIGAEWVTNMLHQMEYGVYA